MAKVEIHPMHHRQTRCIVPSCDGLLICIHNKEALWGKFYTAAPRSVSRQAFCMANLPRGHARNPSSHTTFASFERGIKSRDWHQRQDGREVA